MGKKRSYDCAGASFDASHKKQKHWPSPGRDSLLLKATSSYMGQNMHQVTERYETTQNSTPEPKVDIDKEAYHIAEQASRVNQAGVHCSNLTVNPLRLKHSNANVGLSKALGFSTIQQCPSGASTRDCSSPEPANTPVKILPYNGRPSTLPPLPSITDKALESVAFTHPGSLSCDTASKVNISYDRLEFLGDAYIEVMATRVIFPRFPSLTAGRLSQQRELLVKNETLAEYALAYGFDEKAKLPNTHNPLGKDSRKLWLKTMGDIFEAFVAAVIISDPEKGFQRAEAWLTALWESKLGSQKREDTETVDTKAKTNLAAKIMGRGIRVLYRDEASPVQIRREGKVVFQVGVYLTGWGWDNQYLGSGKGLSKQEAGQRAAADALVNPLTTQVANVKREFDAQLARETGVQGEAESENNPGVR